MSELWKNSIARKKVRNASSYITIEKSQIFKIKSHKYIFYYYYYSVQTSFHKYSSLLDVGDEVCEIHGIKCLRRAADSKVGTMLVCSPWHTLLCRRSAVSSRKVLVKS